MRYNAGSSFWPSWNWDIYGLWRLVCHFRRMNEGGRVRQNDGENKDRATIFISSLDSGCYRRGHASESSSGARSGWTGNEWITVAEWLNVSIWFRLRLGEYLNVRVSLRNWSSRCIPAKPAWYSQQLLKPLNIERLNVGILFGHWKLKDN